MKHIFRKYGKSLAILALSLLLLVSFVLPVAAEDDKSEILFELQPDGTLTDGERVLAQYLLPVGFKLDDTRRYAFDKTDADPYETESFMRETYVAATRDGDIVWSFLHDGVTVYVTDESRARIDGLADGKDAVRQLVFKQTYLPAADTESLLSRILPGEGAVAVDVPATELRGAGYFELRSYETSGVIYKTDALLFLYEDRYGYLDLGALDNSHFDADGNLSFRSGNVPLIFLDDDASAALDEAFKDLPITEKEIVWQSDDIFGSMPRSSTLGMVFFWITVVFCGFVLPGAALILGILLAVTGQKKKRWWALVICATVWLLAAIGILIILF